MSKKAKPYDHTVHYFAVGNDEFAPGRVRAGDRVRCTRCSDENRPVEHELLPSRNADTGQAGSLLFYQCGEKAFLAAIDSKPLDYLTIITGDEDD